MKGPKGGGVRKAHPSPGLLYTSGGSGNRKGAADGSRNGFPHDASQADHLLVEDVVGPVEEYYPELFVVRSPESAMCIRDSTCRQLPIVFTTLSHVRR